MGSESKKTSSCHTTEAETGTHSFKIVGYSLKKGIGVDKFIGSGIFTVGGYDWAIRFYPDGYGDSAKDNVSVYLELMSSHAEVRASCGMSLLNQNTGLPESVCSQSTTTTLFSSKGSPFSPGFLIPRSSMLELESAGYVVDDCLTIECTVTVIRDSEVSNTTGDLEIEVPPPDLADDFFKLLSEEEGANVTFSVGGESIRAHKIVLAARSPVFKAQLYGPMKEKRARRVTVEDMQPDVFRALLHFIYTDSRPDWEDLTDDEYYEINKHLLVAADRYAIERLKLLCASTLVEFLNVENVASTLALADQHSCDRLKDVCIEFMASSGEMDAVVETQGYANLKRTCPSVLVDVLERSSKHRKK
ncbi:hypothetical protein ACP70R_003309 [Stipagrostis hirtigluma subsp. patula]